MAPALATAQGSGQAGSGYPARTVRVINAYSPGGTADVVCRIVFTKLSERLGQSFAVENRPARRAPSPPRRSPTPRPMAIPCSMTRPPIR